MGVEEVVCCFVVVVIGCSAVKVNGSKVVCREEERSARDWVSETFRICMIPKLL